MATLLIGTEVAEGMGHVAPWRDFCALAQKANHAVHMAGPDVGLLHERIASRLPVTLWSAPCGKPLPHHPPAKSWPELLASLGYAQPHWLSGAALAWAAVLDAVQPDAVLCDYAPALMLACQALGVRHYLEVGGGFCVPPIQANGSMPPFPGVQKHNQEATAKALERLSKALSSAGRALSSDRTTAASATWTELHTHAAHRLVTSPPWLDHYETRDPTVAPVTHVGFLGLGDALAPDTKNPAAPLAALQQAALPHPATHIVGYLKPNTPDLGALFAEIASTGLPTQIYCPGYAGPPAPTGITISGTALDLHHQLNPGAIFVTNGGLASVGLALQKRSRLLLAPQQPEQVAMARRLHKLGLGAVALPGLVGAALNGLRQGAPNRGGIYPQQSQSAEEETLRWALDE